METILLTLVLAAQAAIFYRLSRHEHQVLAPITVDHEAVYKLVIEEIKANPTDYIYTEEEYEDEQRAVAEGRAYWDGGYGGYIHIPQDLEPPADRTQEQIDVENDEFVRRLTEAMSKPITVTPPPAQVEYIPETTDEIRTQIEETLSQVLSPPPPIATDEEILTNQVENPIPYYDTLKAMEVVNLLNRLTPIALNQVREYEFAHAKRPVILSRIDGIIRNGYRVIG